MLQRCAFKNLKLWEAQLSNLRILPGTSLTPATTALRAVYQTNIGALLPHAPMQCVHSTACKEHCGQRSAAKAVVTVSAVAVFCCDL